MTESTNGVGPAAHDSTTDRPKPVPNPEVARLALERFARAPEGWVNDRNCHDESVDMMEATDEQIETICGPCMVSEQCLEGGMVGDPVKYGPRGGQRMKRRRSAPRSQD